MENQVTEIALSLIAESSTNEMFRQKKDLTDTALKELADSIRQFGVIQPITVRPYHKNPESFILICGERRLRASQLAGKTTIPATVRDVTQETALILQITENMQREDVHPLHEAKGYRLLLENDDKLTTTELALKFGKSETFILQRLKLNDLVREAKKAFLEDKLSLGQALIIARLTPADQREVLNNAYSYSNVQELQNYVERNITNSLSKAPFDPKDEALDKKAGACIDCPKRSGSSPLLFAEIKDKDRCFDQACFFKKCTKFMNNRVRQAIETEPDLVLLEDKYQEPAEDIATMIAEHNIKPIAAYTDFFEDNQGGSKVKGLWISGRKAGQVQTVYLKKKVEVKTSDSIKAVTSKIEDRMVRGRELDAEKVYARILESLKAHPTQKKGHEQKMLKDEEVFLWYVVYDKAGYNAREAIDKSLGLNLNKPEKFYDKLKNLTPGQRAFMLRKVMLDQYGGNNPMSEYGFIIRKIAEGYGDVDIKTFEKEQREICEKRETRAKERIKLLGNETRKVKA